MPDEPVGCAKPTGTVIGEIGRRRCRGSLRSAAKRETALENVPAERLRKLLEDQAAPTGFWFPRHGIGQLMDAMAEREA